MCHRIPEGTLCDDCLDNGVETPATRAIMMEDTGFGKEYAYFCDECRNWRGYLPADQRHGSCEWCRCYSRSLRWIRDTNEGYRSRKYRVCPRCEQEESDKRSRARDFYGEFS